MFFKIVKEGYTKRRGDLFACFTAGGRRVPWYAGNVRALLPLVEAERRRDDFERVALRLPPLWAAYTGARWGFALRELYNDAGDVVGVEDTGHKSRKVARVHERPKQARKAVRELREAARITGESFAVAVVGMDVVPIAWTRRK